MPVLEVTQLRLKGLPADDPALLQALSTVRDILETNSQFYNCIEDPTLIYILGVWPSLDAHLEFLASPRRDEVLGPQEGILDFCWTIHIEVDGIDALPWSAPVLALERLNVRGDCVNTFNQAALRHTQRLQGSHPFKVAHGWRCDTATGSHEALILSGWKNAHAHITFTAMQERQNGDHNAAINVRYEERQVHHAWNLERSEA